MYNEDAKKDFEQNYESVTCENFFKMLFNKVEPYENLYEKDVCNFVKSEIIEMLRSFASSSIGTLRMTVSILRTYTQWSCDNQQSIDNINHYDEIKTEDIIGCVNTTVLKSKIISKEQLDNHMKYLINPCDRALLLGLFEGLSGRECNELYNLYKEDMDVKESTVYLKETDRTVKVSREFINYALQSIDMYEYNLLTDGGDRDIHLRKTDRSVFKARTNASVDTIEGFGRRIQNKLRIIRQYLDIPALSTVTLVNSGIIHYTKLKAKELGLEPMEVIGGEHFEEIALKYNLSNTKPFQLRGRFKDYLS